MEKLHTFSFQGQDLQTEFIETTVVKPDVVCDVYIHPETEDRDLGIITIGGGGTTPRQKVLGGEVTLEGYLEGEGKLLIFHTDGTQSVFEVDDSSKGFCFLIDIGEIMQWQASKDKDLKVFEVCFPPYKDGRFENLE